MFYGSKPSVDARVVFSGLKTDMSNEHIWQLISYFANCIMFERSRKLSAQPLVLLMHRATWIWGCTRELSTWIYIITTGRRCKSQITYKIPGATFHFLYAPESCVQRSRGLPQWNSFLCYRFATLMISGF